MAYKQFLLASELPVKIYKRKTSRSLRLSVSAHGEVRVSIPTWTPYSAGLQFATSRLSWIQQQLPATPKLLVNGQPVGKAHRLHFIQNDSAAKPTSRIQGTQVVVRYPSRMSSAEAAVQQAAAKACVRALRAQAEQLLPGRLNELALKHGYDYKSVSVKHLKSRWGSCDHQRNIVLNLYLMQLPWDCINYVLLHELAHTRVMQHGPNFWTEMERTLPAAKALRRQMRAFQPILHTDLPLAV